MARTNCNVDLTGDPVILPPAAVRVSREPRTTLINSAMRTSKVVFGSAAIVLFLQCVKGQLFVSNQEGSSVLDVNTCSLYEGHETVGIRGPVRVAPPNIFHRLVATCKPSSRGDSALIFPGTKWCGPGNRADNYFDLGSRSAEDSCCREHDHCPVVLEPGQCRQDVCNDQGVVLSHCACDARFRRCLHSVNTDVADFIGWIYFNLVHVKCFKSRVSCNDFREECPIALHSVLPYRSGRSSSPAASLASALFG